MTDDEAYQLLGMSQPAAQPMTDEEAMRLLGITGELKEAPGPGSISSGMRRKFSSQAVGAQQIGSNIARMLSGEIGAPYSDYRLGVNEEGRRLAHEDKNAGPIDKLGGLLAGGLEMAAIPVPAAALPRMGVNAAIGAGYEALEPQTNPMKMASGALLNAVLPEGAGLLAGVLKGGWSLGKGLLNPQYAAAREAARELTGRGVKLPKMAPSIGDRAMPVDMGPPTPEFARVPGIQPTVAMLTDDPALKLLEQNARVRAGDLFKPRDMSNQRAVYDALSARALPDNEAAVMTDALNQQTGSMREVAFDNIRKVAGAERKAADDQAVANAIADMRERKILPGTRITPEITIKEPDVTPSFAVPLSEKVGKMVTGVTDRAKKSTGLLSSLTQRAMTPRGSEPLDPNDLYNLKKDLSGLIENKSIAPDEMTVAARAARPQVMGLLKSIDAGLDAASGGAYQQYLSAHQAGMKPIEEGRAFQDVLDSFETAPKLDTSGIPAITPAALRRAADRETFGLLGKSGYQDKLSPQGRMTMDDAIKVMDRLESARAGVVASGGSPTAPYLSGLLRMGMPGQGGGAIATAVNMAQALGRTRGAHALDRAMLDPAELQSVLDVYHSMAESPAKRELGAALQRSLKVLPLEALNAGSQ